MTSSKNSNFMDWLPTTRGQETAPWLLSAASAIKLHHVFTPWFGGVGAIFMLHRVDPAEVGVGCFSPNRVMTISPNFLRRVIRLVRSLGYDIISLDEVPERLSRPTGRRFVVFTLDDGYRDNLTHAYPVFLAEKAPFTIYVPADWPDGEGVLWWSVLEEIIAANNSILPGIAGLPSVLPTASVAEKTTTFNAIKEYFEGSSNGASCAAIRNLADRYGVDLQAHCKREIMNWSEIRELASDELVTIGAHTRTHPFLSKLDEDKMRREIVESRVRIEAEIGRPCRHFAYPYGNTRAAGEREFSAAAQAGFLTAVTTRSGLLRAGHKDRTSLLPRINLENHKQDTRYIEIRLSGLTYVLRRGAQ